MIRLMLFAVVLLGASMGAAQAHTGHAADGVLAGMLHPFGGMDHLLAMIAVGIWGVQTALRDRRAVWLVPLAFVAVMVAGGALALAGLRLPLVEVGIAGSVVVLGALVLTAPRLPVWMPMAVAGAFGLFHGVAHGAELPAGAAPMAYVAGFVAATMALHVLGVGIGLAVRQTARALPVRKR
jgi:urease accessory protein